MPRHLSKQKNICENVQADLSLQRLVYNFLFHPLVLLIIGDLNTNCLLLSFLLTRTEKMLALLGNKRK